MKPLPKGSHAVGVLKPSGCFLRTNCLGSLGTAGELELLGQLTFLIKTTVCKALCQLSQVSLAVPLGVGGKSHIGENMEGPLENRSLALGSLFFLPYHLG